MFSEADNLSYSQQITDRSLMIVSHLRSFKLISVQRSRISKCLHRIHLSHLHTYGAEPFLRSCQLCSHSGTSKHFKETEGSSPYSKEPSTCPYPEPDRSSPYYLRTISILSTNLRFCLPSGIFPSTNILYVLLVSPIRATYPAHVILQLSHGGLQFKNNGDESNIFPLMFL
jgi:hypothetical protein